MANIALMDLFESTRLEFGAGAQNDEYIQQFIQSTNMSINWINRLADLESPIARIFSQEDTVGLSEEFDDVLADGIRYNLVKKGRRQRGDPKRVRTIKQLQKEFEDGIQSIQDEIRVTAQADADNEIYGLGATTN